MSSAAIKLFALLMVLIVWSLSFPSAYLCLQKHYKEVFGTTGSLLDHSNEVKVHCGKCLILVSLTEVGNKSLPFFSFLAECPISLRICDEIKSKRSAWRINIFLLFGGISCHTEAGVSVYVMFLAHLHWPVSVITMCECMSVRMWQESPFLTSPCFTFMLRREKFFYISPISPRFWQQLLWIELLVAAARLKGFCFGLHYAGGKKPDNIYFYILQHKEKKIIVLGPEDVPLYHVNVNCILVSNLLHLCPSWFLSRFNVSVLANP